jgi:hypothetical protein
LQRRWQGRQRNIRRGTAATGGGDAATGADPLPQPAWRLLRRFRLPFSQLTVMALRHLVRWPLRTALTTLGTALPVALLITSLFAFDSVDHMIDTIWFRADRQDATLTFAMDRSEDAIRDVARLPGVIAAEPFRAEAATLRNGHRSRNVQIIGSDPDTDISRVLDQGFRPHQVPQKGILLSERLAAISTWCPETGSRLNSRTDRAARCWCRWSA